MTPETGESALAYAERLTVSGHDEMTIRRGLMEHFDMLHAELGPFFNAFPAARFRHLSLLMDLEPGRSDVSLALKAAKDLGIEVAQAEDWVARFRRSGAAST